MKPTRLTDSTDSLHQALLPGLFLQTPVPLRPMNPAVRSGPYDCVVVRYGTPRRSSRAWRPSRPRTGCHARTFALFVLISLGLLLLRLCLPGVS